MINTKQTSDVLTTHADDQEADLAILSNMNMLVVMSEASKPHLARELDSAFRRQPVSRLFMKLLGIRGALGQLEKINHHGNDEHLGGYLGVWTREGVARLLRGRDRLRGAHSARICGVLG